MKIFFHEITDQDTDLDFTESEKWVADAISRVDERLEHDPILRPANKVRAIRTHLNLRKVDEIVVLTGTLDTSIELVCSRCANAFELECHPKLSALFCTDPDTAGIAHNEDGKRVGGSKGFARHAHDYESDARTEAGQDLDITYVTEPIINLSEVLTEQLQLQVPFQPLCKESCKGICANCGADLNVGRCACAKLATTKPFSVLKDLKV